MMKMLLNFRMLPSNTMIGMCGIVSQKSVAPEMSESTFPPTTAASEPKVTAMSVEKNPATRPTMRMSCPPSTI